MNLILSTCGTSILTNIPEADARLLVTRYANAKRSELAPDDLAKLQAHIAAKRQAVLATSDFLAAKRLSAEQNGIISYYGGEFKGNTRCEQRILGHYEADVFVLDALARGLF